MPSTNSAKLGLLLALAVPFASAQNQTEQHPSAQFRTFLDDTFNKHLYVPKFPKSSQWLDGSQRYTALEPSATDPKQLDLVVYVTATGERSVLVPAARFTPAGAGAPLNIDQYTWSADKQQLLLFTNSKKVWRQNTRGDYWVLNLANNSLRKLGGDLPPASLMFAKFSPDGTRVAYVSYNNVYVEEVFTGKQTELTHDGSDNIINGTTDWVTEEEFDLRDAFRWSPDGTRIAYLQFDQSGEGDYTLLNDTATEYPRAFHYKYPLAGTTNAAVRLGVIATDGKTPTRWMELPGDQRNHYIPRFDWVGKDAPQELALEYLNRQQNTNDVYLFQADTGAGRILFTDRDKAWVDIVDDLTWLHGKNNTRDLLWTSESDGWRHLYRITPDGKEHRITNFNADVISLVGVDEDAGAVYFIASPDQPTQRYLYKAKLDGSGKPERLTPASQPGYNSYEAAPDGKVALHTWSNAQTVRHYELVRLTDSKVLKVVENNDEFAAKIKPFLEQKTEFFQVKVDDGAVLQGSMIKPPNFDPTKKYPVLVEVYGEPAAALVTDAFLGALRPIMAREGYILLSFDNAGTPQPLGRAWRKSIYGSIGVLSSQQQASAMRNFAKEHSFIDTGRMAIWGWSGGGSMTLNMMFRYPGLYRAGMAVAPAADQAKYDTIYQERYMGLPQENLKGYHDGSPINFAEGLEGNLLIVHGSGDDNVHFQGTELLINRLVELNKPFDLMVYPNRTHAINEGPGTSVHLYTLLMRYLEDHVPPGPQPADKTN